MAYAAQTGSKRGDNANTATPSVSGGMRRWPVGMWLSQRQLLVLPKQMPNPP